MIIWLPSFPRSGNTYFRIVSFQVFGINTYSGFQSGNSDLDRVGIGDITGHRKLPGDLEVGLKTDNESLWRPYHESDEIYVIKTHARKDELNATHLPTILIVRDGRDAYISLAWYWITVAHGWRLEMPSLKSKLTVMAEKALMACRLGGFLQRRVLDHLVKGKRWADFNQSWLEDEHPAMAVLHFRDLVEDPVRACHDALVGVGAVPGSCDAAGLPDFEYLHGQYPQFFRKGKRGDWRREMRQDQKDTFWSNHGSIMAMLDYPEK
jgi:hypothetical protein